MSETPGTIELIAVSAVGFVLFWLLCFWLIGQLGGWFHLAKRFATDREPKGETFAWASGKTNFFSKYNNCLRVTISNEGIDIRPKLLFRFGHKPLFVPWSAVAVMGAQREMFRYGTAFEIKSEDGVHPITLYGKDMAESLIKHAPDRLLRPPEM